MSTNVENSQLIEFQRARAIGGICIIIYVYCLAFQKEQGRKEEDEGGRKYFTLHKVCY